MNRNTRIFCFLVVTLAALGGCSSGPTAGESKKAATPLDKIQGKVQLMTDAGGASDAAMNAGGQSAYLKQGDRRYRLFLRTAAELADGKEYVAEGVYAQKAIDDIGDPDQGKNGYPLQSSCERAIKMAWSNLAFDEFDADTSLLSAKLKRYPARAIFLVTRIRPATAADSSGAEAETKQDDADLKEVTVAADKQRAFLIAGAAVQTAPLWEPAGERLAARLLSAPTGRSLRSRPASNSVRRCRGLNFVTSPRSRAASRLR